MKKSLESVVDFFLDVSDLPCVKSSCIESNKKGYGELVKTKLAINFLKENNIMFERLFKISGRYYLTDEFQIEKYSKKEFSFRFDNNNGASTVLYSVPFLLLNKFEEIVCECLTLYESGDYGLEYLLPIRCTPAINIDKLGVAGMPAISRLEFYQH